MAGTLSKGHREPQGCRRPRAADPRSAGRVGGLWAAPLLGLWEAGAASWCSERAICIYLCVYICIKGIYTYIGI